MARRVRHGDPRRPGRGQRARGLMATNGDLARVLLRKAGGDKAVIRKIGPDTDIAIDRRFPRPAGGGEGDEGRSRIQGHRVSVC